VNLYWSFLRTAPAQQSGVIDYDTTYVGAANGPCAESAVDSVTVDSPVGQVTVSCVHTNGVQGVGIDGLPAGAQTFRFRGYRGSGSSAVLVYDSVFTLDVHANMTMNYYVAVQGVAAPLGLSAWLAYYPGPVDYTTCAAATPAWGSGYSSAPPNLHYEIRDVVFKELVEVGTVGCAPAQTIPAPVFSGLLDLDDYSVRVQGLRVEDNAVVLDSCWVSLQHFANEAFEPTAVTDPIAGPPNCPAL
jgi:hypothetical protein